MNLTGKAYLDFESYRKRYGLTYVDQISVILWLISVGGIYSDSEETDTELWRANQGKDMANLGIERYNNKQ